MSRLVEIKLADPLIFKSVYSMKNFHLSIRRFLSFMTLFSVSFSVAISHSLQAAPPPLPPAYEPIGELKDTNRDFPARISSRNQLILAQGDGWARVKPNIEAYKKMLLAQGKRNSEEYVRAESYRDKEMLAITTIGGLVNSGLPPEYEWHLLKR